MFRYLIIFSIKLYQRIISPLIPARCRFYPSCSTYAHQSIKHLGVFRGSFYSAKRIIKCNPFNPGGYDPVVKEK